MLNKVVAEKVVRIRPFKETNGICRWIGYKR